MERAIIVDGVSIMLAGEMGNFFPCEFERDDAYVVIWIISDH